MTSPRQAKLPLPQGEGRGEGASNTKDLPNLDTIRLAAALLVLFSHAFILTGHPEAEPIAILTNHTIDGGALAVGAFFALSGHLIARSAERHPWRRYLAARALRIYPALAACILAQTLLLGPAFSSLGPAAYFAAPATWSALARALLFSPPPGLPGLFDANPLPGIVNGSLWTLRIEAACYLLTLAWSLLGAPRLLLAVAVAAAAAALAGAQAAGAGLRITAMLDCLLHFAAGAALWCWRDRLVVHGSLPLLVAAIAIAAPAPALASAAWHLAIPGAVLWLGRQPGPRLPDDISYGTYLYAFPVAQLLVATWPGLTPCALAAAAAPPTLLLALLSRHLVERPALRWKPA